MKIKVIHNEEAHEAALRDLEELMGSDPRPGTSLFEELELLALVIKAYEDQKFPIAKPGAIDAIKFRLEQQGQSRKDLIRHLGSRGRVSEVLNGKRPLSLAMIRALHCHFQIPAEVLIGKSATKAQRNPARRKNARH